MAEKRTPDDLADNELDPGASTQMFRAFVTEGEAETAQAAPRGRRLPILIGGAVVLIAVVVALLVL